MTDHHAKLRDAGLRAIGGWFDGKPQVFHEGLAPQDGDLIVRPLPPPEPTVEEARVRLVVACADEKGWGETAHGALDALIAAAERRGREG